MLVAGILFYITSLTIHAFMMRHPQIKDICDRVLAAVQGQVVPRGQQECVDGCAYLRYGLRLVLAWPGLYAAVEAIMDDYSGAVKPDFSCANVAI